MKILLSLLLLLPIAAVHLARAQELEEFDYKVAAKWARENREKFPAADLGRQEKSPFAKLNTILKLKLEHQGREVSGLRYKLPEWTDGPICWMITSPTFANQPEEAKESTLRYQFHNLDNEAEYFASISMFHSNPVFERYKVFQSFYPERRRFATRLLFGEAVKGGEEHLILFFDRKGLSLPEVDVAFTMESDRGMREFGQLPNSLSDYGPGSSFQTITGEDPGNAVELMEEAHTTFVNNGREAAEVFLNEKWSYFQPRGGKYEDWWTALWQSAQYKYKNDKEWKILAYDYLYRQAKDWDAYFRSVIVAPNLSMAYDDLYRHAEGRQCLDVFYFMMRRMKLSLNIADYPEVSPGIASLPSTKTRAIPLVPPAEISYVSPAGVVFYQEGEELNRSHVAALQRHSFYQYLAGEQLAAMEWNLALLDLVSRMKGFKKDVEVDERWLETNNSVAQHLYDLGYYSDAYYRYEKTVTSKGLRSGGYGYRSIQRAKIGMAECRSAVGYVEKDDLQRIADTKEKIAKNQYLSADSVHWAELVKAKHLLIRGQDAEALSTLNRLVDEKNYIPAKIVRIQYHLNHKKTEGIEKQLLDILRLYRSQGLKIHEWRLYSIYADLLILEERWEEAIQMRREALRLTQAFQMHLHTTWEMAKLSSLLKACGQESEGGKLASTVHTLLSEKERYPPRDLKLIAAILSKPMAPATLTASQTESATHLQPVEALVVPLKGRGGYGKISLANLSDSSVAGRLECSGLPVILQKNEAESEIRIRVSETDEVSSSDLLLDPGTFLLLSLENLNPYQEGELLVEWLPKNGTGQKSQWTFSPEEEGVARAVIDAGRYELNDFYGVPLYHHLLGDLANEDATMTFRVESTPPARIEIYDMDDKPLLIDTDGDGELSSPGDSLLSDQDNDGLVDCKLTEGFGSIRLQVYPLDELPEEGLKVRLYGLLNNEWTLMSENALK